MTMQEPSSSERSFISVDAPMALIFVGSILVVLLACAAATLSQLTVALERYAVTVVGPR